MSFVSVYEARAGRLCPSYLCTRRVVVGCGVNVQGRQLSYTDRGGHSRPPRVPYTDALCVFSVYGLCERRISIKSTDVLYTDALCICVRELWSPVVVLPICVRWLPPLYVDTTADHDMPRTQIQCASVYEGCGAHVEPQPTKSCPQETPPGAALGKRPENVHGDASGRRRPQEGLQVWSLQGGFGSGSLQGDYRSGSLQGGYRSGSLQGGYRSGNLQVGYRSGSLQGRYRSGSLQSGSLQVWEFTGVRQVWEPTGRLQVWEPTGGLHFWEPTRGYNSGSVQGDYRQV